jgi:hypothetical protein
VARNARLSPESHVIAVIGKAKADRELTGMARIGEKHPRLSAPIRGKGVYQYIRFTLSSHTE